MSRAHVYVRNLAANWVGYGANLLVMFFLTPFIVHSLGTAAYGLWTLMVSLAGYFGLADVGIRMSVGRFINYHMARGETDEINNTVNSAFMFFAPVGAVLLGLAALLGASFAAAFPNVQPQWEHQATAVLMLAAGQVFLAFYSSTFWSVVVAHEHFVVRNVAALVTLAVRTTAVVIALKTGRGLVALAAIAAACEVLNLLAAASCAFRYDRALRVGIHWCHFGHLRRMLSYGVGAFLSAVSQRVIYFIDVVVIGWLLGARDITYYSIGLMFVQYGRGLLQEIVRTMYPRIGKQGGMRDAHVERVITFGATRAIMLFTVPLMCLLITQGRELIVTWMGDESFAASARILVILAVAQLFSMSSEAWRNMLASLGHIWMVSIVSIIEAAANMLLSVALVLGAGMGIEGVAAGTLIPSVLFMGLILPGVGASLLRIHLRFFARAVTIRWVSATVICLLLGSAVARLPLPLGGWIALSVRLLLAGGAMMAVCWLLVPTRQERQYVAPAMGPLGRWLVPPAPPAPLAPAEVEPDDADTESAIAAAIEREEKE